MSNIPIGAVKFSEIQSVLGGVNPIKFSEYYADASEGHSTGVSGIPNRNSPIKVSQFRGKSKPASGNGLYAFSSHTFTNASATGRFGPSLSQCRTAYSSAAWTQDSINNWLNMVDQGIQLWKVPATGSYTIQCYGASGGSAGTNNGGRGTLVTGTFNLTQNQVLGILVGQEGGSNGTCNAGGGGGTFVWNTASTSEPLIVAGGGGGANSASSGLNAETGTGGSGTNGTPGTNGNGATPGGAGWKTNGGSGFNGNNSGCQRPLAGGSGGAAISGTTVGNGGFGGGASASGEPCSNGGPGGGGGYSGGAGPGTTTATSAGGGGGSYNSGTNTSSSVRTDSGNGYVTITANFTITTGGSLYSFSSHTFTNASATGRSGPSLSQCRSAYSSATWAQDTTNNYLNMTTQGIQLWTVPETANYTVTMAGAKGGDTGGNGRIINATISLVGGAIIKILVGQQGIGAGFRTGGGGGASFIATNLNQPILVAPGGGGRGENGLPSFSVDGVFAQGTDTAGATSQFGSGGASFSFNSSNKTFDNKDSGAFSFTNGGTGGKGGLDGAGADGGFGGGGGACSCSTGQGGGGGGYQGGSTSSTTTTIWHTGGGGSSYYGGEYVTTTNVSNFGTNEGNGYVTITKS